MTRCDNYYCKWRSTWTGGCDVSECVMTAKPAPVTVEQLQLAHGLSDYDAAMAMRIIEGFERDATRAEKQSGDNETRREKSGQSEPPEQPKPPRSNGRRINNWSKIDADIDAGMSMKDAAKKYSMTYGKVYYHRVKIGKHKPDDQYEKWLPVDADVDAGMSMKDAAKRHNVKYSTLCAHTHRRIYEKQYQ